MNFIVANGISIVALFGITGWMLKMWLSHQERMKGLSMSTQGAASTDQRLARVEQAVEAVAIEIERISEGQRFVTKLLAGRAPAHDGVTPAASRTDAH
jgi:aspartate 1-decarboxylase